MCNCTSEVWCLRTIHDAQLRIGNDDRGVRGRQEYCGINAIVSDGVRFSP
jgi:hypothetical protein